MNAFRSVARRESLVSTCVAIASFSACLTSCGGSDSHSNTPANAAGIGATSGDTAGGATAAGGVAASGATATGGTVATGGTAGSGNAAGAPVHEVGTCANLGAIDEFQQIAPPGVDLTNNGVVHVMLDPVHSGTVFCGTDHKGLFKSTDCGSTWVKVNTGRNAATLDGGILWVMAIDPTNPDILYAGSLYATDSSLLRSTNGGVDWDSLFPAGGLIATTVEYSFFQTISLDPTNPQHLVVTFHAVCSGNFGKECLAQSTDRGATWSLFKGPLDSWQEGAGPYVLNGTTWLLSTTQNGLFYTADSGGTWEKVGPGTNLSFYKRADGSYFTIGDYGVLRSADGHVWKTVDNSPHGNGIVGDGVRMFISNRDAGDQQQPYLTSPEGDGNTWTPYSSPKMEHGGHYLRYDADHRLMYSANTSSGLWRVVTR